MAEKKTALEKLLVDIRSMSDTETDSTVAASLEHVERLLKRAIRHKREKEVVTDG